MTLMLWRYLTTAELHREWGEYEETWEVLKTAAAVSPLSARVAEAQFDAAVRLIRKLTVSAYSAEYLEQLLPILHAAVGSIDLAVRGTAFTYLAWAEYIRANDIEKKYELDEAKVRRLLGEALSLGGDLAYAHLLLGILADRAGNTDAAADYLQSKIEHFTKARDLSGNDRDVVITTLAYFFFLAILAKTRGTMANTARTRPNPAFRRRRIHDFCDDPQCRQSTAPARIGS